jgi:hypothetical protein
MFIDADTHVDESEATFSYIPASQDHLRPRTIEFTDDQMPPWLGADRSSGSGLYRYWFIDGNLYPRRVRSDSRTRTVVDTRELSDVGARVKHMDSLNVETQIVYPTLFLREVSERADVVVALHKSYNRWLAERCADSGGRIRWVALIPYRSMPDALEEIRFAKDNGAVGIFKLGIETGGLAASDPYFFPAYELAADLDLPLCIHQGGGFTGTVSFLRTFPGGERDTFPVISAFSFLLSSDIPKRFANLKVGFIESGAAWLPHVLGRGGWTWDKAPAQRDRRLADLGYFVTCEIYEDIPYIMNVVGGDENLFVGSDYTHGDRSAVLDVHQLICNRPDIDDKTALKLTSENARRFYGL